VLSGLVPDRKPIPFLRICHRILFGIHLAIALAITILGFTDQILFYQLAVLLLTPILPISVCAQLLLERFDPMPGYVRYDLYALSLLLPLSAFLRPISYEASLRLSMIGLPALILLPLAILIFLRIKGFVKAKRSI
jgi:hypothetical protein